jgi:hypothetical protein
MQTITKQINLYSFNELSDDIKQEVINNWRVNDEYFWSSENADSLNAFCDIFNIKINDYEYGYRNYINASFNLDDDVLNLSGLKLHKHLINNYYREIFKPKYYYKNSKKRLSKIQLKNDCVLTGYCIDNSILQPMYDFLKKPYNTDFESLLNDCLNSWLNACRYDYDFWNSAECIIDEIESNDYLFLDNGNIYS